MRLVMVGDPMPSSSSLRSALAFQVNILEKRESFRRLSRPLEPSADGRAEVFSTAHVTAQHKLDIVKIVIHASTGRINPVPKPLSLFGVLRPTAAREVAVRFATTQQLLRGRPTGRIGSRMHKQFKLPLIKSNLSHGCAETSW
jgi:hypothetical protein